MPQADGTARALPSPALRLSLPTSQTCRVRGDSREPSRKWRMNVARPSCRGLRGWHGWSPGGHLARNARIVRMLAERPLRRGRRGRCGLTRRGGERVGGSQRTDRESADVFVRDLDCNLPAPRRHRTPFDSQLERVDKHPTSPLAHRATPSCPPLPRQSGLPAPIRAFRAIRDKTASPRASADSAPDLWGMTSALRGRGEGTRTSISDPTSHRPPAKRTLNVRCSASAAASRSPGIGPSVSPSRVKRSMSLHHPRVSRT